MLHLQKNFNKKYMLQIGSLSLHKIDFHDEKRIDKKQTDNGAKSVERRALLS